MYRVEMIFRFNQNDSVPECIKNIHRVANTDYFEILAGDIEEKDFEEAHTFLNEQFSERNMVSFYFEVVRM